VHDARQSPHPRTATTIARQRVDARQRIDARQRSTAHGKALPHGNGPGARQRCHARQRSNAHGNASNAQQRPLLCMYGSAHGKEFVAVRDFAVGTLPSVDARQRLCRVFYSLCRAPPTHGKDTVSGSDASARVRSARLGQNSKREDAFLLRLSVFVCVNTKHVPTRQPN
jgi:hypothetical protein